MSQANFQQLDPGHAGRTGRRRLSRRAAAGLSQAPLLSPPEPDYAEGRRACGSQQSKRVRPARSLTSQTITIRPGIAKCNCVRTVTSGHFVTNTLLRCCVQ